jgi:hypothetical protein
MTESCIVNRKPQPTSPVGSTGHRRMGVAANSGTLGSKAADARTEPRKLARRGRNTGLRIGERLKLAALALAGVSMVSIPVTIALVCSVTGAPDVPNRGQDAAARQDLVELQRSVGHVASHGFSHEPLTRLTSHQLVAELQATARVPDYPNALVRAPGGVMDAAREADVRRSGLTVAGWPIDPGDRHASADAIVRRALAVRPGGIERLHEGVGATVEAVPAIVDGLCERGLCPGFVAPTGERAVKP